MLKPRLSNVDNSLLHLAFENSLQANIITITGTGKIIKANNAACKLLGYSKSELLTRSRTDIFDTKTASFKKMMKQRKAEGGAKAQVTGIKKNGKPFPCDITSGIFIGEHGIEKAIFTISDISNSIKNQKIIDTKKDKIVADNIILALSRQIDLDVKNKAIVAKNIVLALSKQLEIDTKNKKIVADNIALAISKQIKIDAKSRKVVADNIALAISKQKVIDIKNKRKVAENIVLAILKQIKIDAKNKKIVAENIVIALAKQIEIDQKNKKIVADNIALAISTQKNIDTKKEKLVAKNIVLALSTQKNIDAKNKKIVAHDIMEAQKKSNKEKKDYNISTRKILTEYGKNFKLIFNSSSDVLYDSNLNTGIVTISNAYYKEYGYKIRSNMTPAKDWVSHIHPDDQENVNQDFLRALKSKDAGWKYSYRFVRANGSIADVISNAVVIRNSEGKAIRLIGYMTDVSKQKVLQHQLELEINLKEKQIKNAMNEAKESERSEIGKELHDNVNQLLGASKLFLEMAKQGGENSEIFLSRSSEYTLQAIEEIRKLSKGLTTDLIKNFGLCEAIANVTRDTMQVSPVKISCDLDCLIEDVVNDKFKIDVFRIVQEQLNNILKYARATKVNISLSQIKRSIVLSISDNGIGFNTDKQRKGIGIDNIKSRALSHKGKADFVSQSGRGCILKVTFPVTDVLLH